MPDAYAVKHLPSWMPFHKEAKNGGRMIEQMISKPFQHVLSQIVRQSIISQTNLILSSLVKATGNAAPSLTKHLLEEALADLAMTQDQYHEEVKWTAGAFYGGEVN